MTLIKYWYCFPHRRHCGGRVRHSNLTLLSFCVCLFFHFLSNWTRYSSCITALSLLSCHDWVYVTFYHETHIQFRRGHRWNDPSFYYDIHTCFLNVRWTLFPLSIEFVVASNDSSEKYHLSYVTTSRTLRMSSQSIMQRVAHTHNMKRYRK